MLGTASPLIALALWAGLQLGGVNQPDLIIHTVDQIAIAFPGGSNNVLTLPVTPLRSEAVVRVVDRGEWSTKSVTSSRVAGRVLEVAATTSTGWWRDGDPDRAEPTATDYRRRFTLTPGISANALDLGVRLTDEKGEVEYRQHFRREQ